MDVTRKKKKTIHGAKVTTLACVAAYSAAVRSTRFITYTSYAQAYKPLL